MDEPDRPGYRRDGFAAMMNFVIEKLFLTGPDGGSRWSETPAPHRLCEAAGADAAAVLALVIADQGDVPVGVSASFRNGQAVMVAQRGESLYALRAIPEPASAGDPLESGGPQRHRLHVLLRLAQ